MHASASIVGRPPDMRSLGRESNSSLAVLEFQSAGARRSRVNNKTLREERRAIKKSHARSEKRIAARRTNRPSYSRPEKEGPRTTRASIVDKGHHAMSKGGARTMTHTPAKNKPEEHRGASQKYARLYGLKGWGTQAIEKPPASKNCKKGAIGWPADAAEQRVPGHDLAGRIDRASSKGAADNREPAIGTERVC